MSKINLLDIHVANLIAAGEVVERPASALKELVENSIDAGASVVTVEIKNGGITYMRVTDNGEGMTAEDLGRCILRHSTSKIASENDLGRIKTLGFRGEALAAISSVSEMKIFSKHKDSDTGYLLETSSGQNTRISEAGCAYGTTVVVERLFSKVPARQKFMKRDATEGMYCKSAIEKIALSNPFVSIRFIQDGKEKIFTPGGGSYKNAVYSIYKDDVGDTLIPIIDINAENSRKKSGIKVSGFICRIEDCKNTRADENFFVNGRYIRSKTILAALEEAYDSVSETGKFPLCVLYLTIDESSIDVNVHPQKMEVKFANEREVFEAVYYAVKNTLEQSGFKDLSEEDDDIDDDDEEESENNGINIDKSDKEPQVEVIKHNFDKFDDLDNDGKIDNVSGGELVSAGSENFIQNNKVPVQNEIPAQYENKKEEGQRQDLPIHKPQLSDTATAFDENRSKYKFIGEVFYGYILIEKDGKLIVIDKHAAHERIIYDSIKHRATAEINQYKSQILLVPVEIKLSPEELAGIWEFKDDIEKIGLIFDIKGDDSDTILIKEVPTEIKDVNIEDIVREMAYMIAEENNHMAHEIALEKFITVTAKKTTACRAAMKSGIRDEPEHLMWVADQVLKYEGVKYCPHGRPIAVEVTKKELENQFRR